MREGKGEKKEEMVGGKGKEMGRGLVSLTKVDVQCYKLDRRLTTVKFISLRAGCSKHRLELSLIHI